MPDTIIPFYSLTLANLVSARGRLVVWCRACRRTAYLDVIPVLAKRGPGKRVSDLGRFLTCDGCRQKGWADVRVEWF